MLRAAQDNAAGRFMLTAWGFVLTLSVSYSPDFYTKYSRQLRRRYCVLVFLCSTAQEDRQAVSVTISATKPFHILNCDFCALRFAFSCVIARKSEEQPPAHTVRSAALTPRVARSATRRICYTQHRHTIVPSRYILPQTR